MSNHVKKKIKKNQRKQHTTTCAQTSHHHNHSYFIKQTKFFIFFFCLCFLMKFYLFYYLTIIWNKTILQTLSGRKIKFYRSFCIYTYNKIFYIYIFSHNMTGQLNLINFGFIISASCTTTSPDYNNVTLRFMNNWRQMHSS